MNNIFIFNVKIWCKTSEDDFVNILINLSKKIMINIIAISIIFMFYLSQVVAWKKKSKCYG